MGMYTGVRMKVFVKPEFRELIQSINRGAEWSDFIDEYPFLNHYASFGRAGFIPRGTLCYMPDSWEDIPKDAKGKPDYFKAKATDGFERKIDINSGLWTFQCSLKNYEREIECFFAEVLPNIIESAEHIETFYEENSVSTMYDFVDNKIIVSTDKEGIRYNDYDLDDNRAWY